MAVRSQWLVILLLITGVQLSKTAKILGLFPVPSKSHMAVNSAIVKELAERGHDVTVVSPFPEKNEIPNYKDIALDANIFEKYFEANGLEEPDTFSMQELTSFELMLMLWGLGSLVCEMYLQDAGVQGLIQSKDENFDVIIIEAFINDCFLGFAHKFNAPVVQVCSFGGTAWMGDWVGNPNPYSYVPDGFAHFSDRMTFWERLTNTVTGEFVRMGRKYYYLPKQDAIARKYFNYTNDLPSISELETSTALVLVNNHFSLNYPKPLTPNLVQVGGMHIKPPQELPEDIKTFLDEAPDGVIYFSMGSNLKSSEMPQEKKQAFLEVFSRLKQRVLWKWETDSLPGQSSNVKLGKWLPQSDILAHPNVRLFITHGGLLSTQETVDRGVPIVGIPIYGDQKLNMLRTVSVGIGVLLEFKNVTTDSLTWAVTEVIENPRYRENAQRLSRIYRDQPLTPLQQAVYWTEYVIRHKGARHMRSAALDLAWYQYFLLDVIAVIALAVGSVLVVTFLILRALLRKMVGGNRCVQTSLPASQKKKN